MGETLRGNCGRRRGREIHTAVWKTPSDPQSSSEASSTSASVASGFTILYCLAIWSRYRCLYATSSCWYSFKLFSNSPFSCLACLAFTLFVPSCVFNASVSRYLIWSLICVFFNCVCVTRFSNCAEELVSGEERARWCRDAISWILEVKVRISDLA